MNVRDFPRFNTTKLIRTSLSKSVVELEDQIPNPRDPRHAFEVLDADPLVETNESVGEFAIDSILSVLGIKKQKEK